MIEKKCRLIENAKNDPKWNAELNAELCFGDCNTCPHNLESEKEKLSKLIDALVNHFRKKQDREINPLLLNYISQEEDDPL